MMPTTIRIIPTIPAGFMSARSEWTPALEQIDDQHYDGEDE
jgi:hypothetical protein